MAIGNLQSNVLAFGALALMASLLTVLPSIMDHSVPRIEWDESTLTLVRRGGVYARMIRLQNGEILCGYDVGAKVHVSRSKDNGKTWGDETFVCAASFGGAANTEILQLQNGWILLSFNERPMDRVHPFTIKTCISKDHGYTWSPPSLVYEADVMFENGCWEPAQIQLPIGEVQLFFANENPYRNSTEQEITLVRSFDNGLTWTPPETVSFRKGHRDGMPVPLALRNGKGIVLAIEDNGLNGNFKPAIVHTSLKANWKEPPADGNNPRRWSALTTPLPADVYAGAPYIRQLPSGETVLSCQSTEGNRKEAQMVVYIGDENAKNFAHKSVPFKLAPDTPGLWNSLFVKDDNTVTAISGTIINGVAGIWAIDGRVVRRKRD
jgi:hypothetical protein